MSTSDILSGIAIVISIAGFCWNIFVYKDKKRIRLVFFNIPNSSESELYRVKIVNAGDRKVIITSCLVIADTALDEVVFCSTELPIMIESLDECSIELDYHRDYAELFANAVLYKDTSIRLIVTDNTKQAIVSPEFSDFFKHVPEVHRT